MRRNQPDLSVCSARTLHLTPSTPTTIKAVVLKYVEACEIITDVRRGRAAPRESTGESATGTSASGVLESAASAAASVVGAQKQIASGGKQVRADLPELKRTARELGRLLRLFQDGVVILDEVDLILHPLKSELNFPIVS